MNLAQDIAPKTYDAQINIAPISQFVFFRALKATVALFAPHATELVVDGEGKIRFQHLRDHGSSLYREKKLKTLLT